MNNKWNAITAIFSGKGGTIRFIVASALVGAVVYKIIEAKYGVTVNTKDGSVSVAPAEEAGIQQFPEPLAIAGEPEKVDPASDQEEAEEE